MNKTHGTAQTATPYRVLLQKRLVYLIAGLRRHQVEEAMQLLLDYIDQRDTNNNDHATLGGDGHLLHHRLPKEVLPEIVPLALCEAKRLVIRPGQPYVFLPDLECDACNAELTLANKFYGSDAIKEQLIASRAIVDKPWPCQAGEFS